MAHLPDMDVSENEASKLHTIGKGFCGTVWAASDEGHAYKREDGGPDRSLKNDFEMHTQILQGVKEFSDFYKTQPELHIHIPACYNFINSTEQTWWSTNLSRFPSGYTPCNILKSQRIPPFAQAVRQILIDNFCPPNIAQQITISEPDKDCLVRPYLGRRRTRRLNSTSQFTAFSLRNYPLHLDQMETLGITTDDIQQYTRAMAEILALMHWVANIDGNDIEFVLAPPRRDMPAPSSPMRSNILGEHVVWVLDFDLCTKMTMDLKGVEQAVAAFWGNDPYYPRPQTEPFLWNVFRDQYLRMSDLCAALFESSYGEIRRVLSQKFVEGVEKEGKRRREQCRGREIMTMHEG